jgi:hypothetical protein
MGRTDRQIEAIQKLVKTGMKLIVRIEAAQARTDAKIDRLAEMWRSDRPTATRNAKLGVLFSPPAGTGGSHNRRQRPLRSLPK